MENTEKSQNKTKVLVNVYEPLIAILKYKLDAACLKRDAYLDLALNCECGYLREEVTTPNSEKTKNFITDNLKQLRLKPLNLLLSTETVDLMNEVCKEKNIPRDAFINRFFLLLIASDTLLAALFSSKDEELDFSDYSRNISQYGSEEEFFYNRPSILDTIEDFVKTSPLWWIRNYCDFNHDGLALYRYFFEKTALLKLPEEYAFLKDENALGFNTFITDDQVSAQEDADRTVKIKNAELDKLLTFARKEKLAKPKPTKPSEEAK
jgi:hypothetical protein